MLGGLLSSIARLRFPGRFQVCGTFAEKAILFQRTATVPFLSCLSLGVHAIETLRVYYRWMKPKTYLFPGTHRNWRVDKPITARVLWGACREAAERAGIDKPVRPHLLRHSFATHLLEQGADLPTLQALLGHADLKATSIYLHLSERHLKAAGTPIDQVEFSSPDKVKRSKNIHKKT